MRKCKRCGSEKPLTSERFYQRKKDGGFDWTCKSCRLSIQKTRLDAEDAKERGGRLADMRQYDKDNRISANARRRASYAKNPESERERGKRRRKDPKHLAKMAELQKKWREEHPDRARAATARWRRNNIDQARDSNRRRQAKLRETPRYRLYAAVSKRMQAALRGSKGGRSWPEFVPYSVEQLVAHLELQFLPGMTWENYGSVWHVDHIRPVSSFSFETPQDIGFVDCWALTNLRPLWALDNLIKKDRRLFLV